MNDQVTLIETLFEKTEGYVKTSAELFKLKAIDKSADVLSVLTARLGVVLFFTLCFLILNVGAALWLGEISGKVYYGFFMVGGFYGIGGFLLHTFRNAWIKIPLRNLIITQALDEAA